MGTASHFKMSSKGTVTIRPRKFLTNRLLERRQMILDVHHPGLATPDKEQLAEMLAEYLSKAKGHKAVKEATVIFGTKTVFGGGKSSCFASSTTPWTPPRSTSPSTASSGPGTSRSPLSTLLASSVRRRRTARRSSVALARRSVSARRRNKLSAYLYAALSTVQTTWKSIIKPAVNFK